MGVYSVFNAIGRHPLNSYTPMHAEAREMWLSHAGQPPSGIVGWGRWAQLQATLEWLCHIQAWVPGCWCRHCLHPCGKGAYSSNALGSMP